MAAGLLPPPGSRPDLHLLAPAAAARGSPRGRVRARGCGGTLAAVLPSFSQQSSWERVEVYRPIICNEVTPKAGGNPRALEATSRTPSIKLLAL